MTMVTNPPVVAGRALNFEPHRGTLVLILGILSIVLQCFPLGLVAWILGSGDLKKIRARQMDPEGEGLTKAGWICGIIGTCLGGLFCCMGILGIFVNAMAQQVRLTTRPLHHGDHHQLSRMPS